MGLQGYVGTSGDAQRIVRQEKEREEERRKFEEARSRAETAGENAFKSFGAGSSEMLEQTFRNETVGLVSRAEFAEKRATLQERYEQEQQEKRKAADDQVEKERQRRRNELKANANKLSFADEEDEDEEGDFPLEPPRKVLKKVANYGKNPDAETSFLPDKDREMEEAIRREKLKEEFLQQEEAAKQQPLKIVYSYWDGSGHRKDVTIKQGDTVEAFLKAAMEQLAPEFREIRSSSVPNLMYIKEDVILGHSMTFHDLIVSKARGKSGPLFHFDVHDDVRLASDARIEKDESHAGKIVERHWYDRNKHIFPASRWEEYDPNKKYDKYTIH